MEPFLPTTINERDYLSITLNNHAYIEGRVVEKATIGITVETFEDDRTFIPWASIAHMNTIDFFDDDDD